MSNGQKSAVIGAGTGIATLCLAIGAGCLNATATIPYVGGFMFLAGFFFLATLFAVSAE